MSMLADTATQTDLLNRLKRAEGQLRGIQRMIEEGQPCLDIASQMAAVRKALDSTYVRMTVCFMQQEMQQEQQVRPRHRQQMQQLQTRRQQPLQLELELELELELAQQLELELS